MWRRHSEGQVGLSTGSRGSQNKENDPVDGVSIMSDPELDGSELSLRAQVDVSDVVLGIELDEANTVQQEEGYISPSPSCSRDAQDLSSPVWHNKSRKRRLRSHEDATSPSAMELSDEDEQDFNTDILSSPTSAKRPEATAQMVEDYETPTKWSRHGPYSSRVCNNVLVGPTPIKQPYDDVDEVPSPMAHRGPDLRKMLAEDGIMRSTKSELPLQSSDSTLSSRPPDTPGSEGGPVDVCIVKDTTREAIDMDLTALGHEERVQCDGAASRTQAVMAGWRQKWALSAKNVPATSNQSASDPSTLTTFLPGSGISRGSNLRRSETTVTPAGHHPGHKAFSKAHNPALTTNPALGTVRKRPRLVFDDTKMSSGNMAIKVRKPMVMTNAKPSGHGKESTTRPTTIGHSMQDEVEILSRAQDKLSKYRSVNYYYLCILALKHWTM